MTLGRASAQNFSVSPGRPTRLKALHEQGAKALSCYDIEIAHQGDAKEALRIAK
jgi:hypothetical protein